MHTGMRYRSCVCRRSYRFDVVALYYSAAADSREQPHDEVIGLSHRNDAVVQQRPSSSARGFAGEIGLLRLRGHPAFADLVVQLCAEAVRWSRRIFSFSPGIGPFRTALVQTFCNRFFPRTSSTISGMVRRSPPPSWAGPLPMVLRHARGNSDMLDTVAVGPLVHAENRIVVHSVDAPFCPAMKLYSSNALQQGSVHGYTVLRISPGLVVGRMSSELAHDSLSTGQPSDTFQMMLLPFNHEQLQLGEGGTAPTAAASDFTIAIRETTGNFGCQKRSARGVGRLVPLTSMRGRSPARAGRERSPSRRRLSPSRRTSPQASITGLRLSHSREEGTARSNVLAALGGGGASNEGDEAVRECCFGMPCLGASFEERTSSLVEHALHVVSAW